MSVQQSQAGSDDPPSDRGIINEEGAEDEIPIFGWRQTDAMFVVVISVGAFLLGLQFGFLWVPITIAGILVGWIPVYAKPKGVNILEAGRIAVEYLIEPDIIRLASKEAGPEVRNEGSLFDNTPFQPDDRAQDLTQVKLAFPGEDAILSEDGRMERFIEIHGDSMDFATSGTWATRQDVGQELANRAVEDRIKIYATTQDFDFDAVIEQLKERKEHHDIKNAPSARALLEDYYERRPKELEEKGLQETRVFLVPAVARKDVSTGFADEQRTGEKIKNIPILGRILDRIIGFESETEQSEEQSEEVIHRKMIDKLDEISRDIEDNYINSTDGYTYSRPSAVEMMVLLARFNNKRDVDAEYVETAIGQTDDTTSREEVLN